MPDQNSLLPMPFFEQGISVFDSHAHLLTWNTAFLSIFGFQEANFLPGQSFDPLLDYCRANPSVDTLNFMKIAAAFCQKGVLVSAQAEVTSSDGRLIHCRCEKTPEGSFIILCADVSEQRYIEHLSEYQNIQLEEKVLRRTAQLENANANLRQAIAENERIAAALQRNESRLRLINDTIPIQIGYVDKDEVFQYANKGYSDWFSSPAGFFIGCTVRSVVGKDVYLQVREHLKKALGGTLTSYEYRLTRDGATCFAHSTLVPEKTAAGETVGFFVFSYDITEQKQMQAALIQAQKMEAIGQLTGGLAHDFNNLLTVIIGNLAALQDHHPEERLINDFVEPALQSARRGVQHIRRLLTFSRQQPLESRAVDIARLISDFEKLARRFLPESIQMDVSLSKTPLFAQVDPGQFESALLNFALNARDAMLNGGVLKIVAERVDLQEEARCYGVPAGNYLIIEVVDNGCGMDENTVQRAFEPFFTTKRFGLGSGLGLPMAHGFARHSGGGLFISSRVGEGTTVSLALPEVMPEIIEATLPADEIPLEHDGKLTLLVEDEPSVRRVVRQQLVDLGYPVIEAENGAEALDMIEQISDIALVISDIIMPGGINGWQLADAVVARHPDVKVLLMSGYHEEMAENMARDMRVLAKPFDRNDLSRALFLATQPRHLSDP